MILKILALGLIAALTQTSRFENRSSCCERGRSDESIGPAGERRALQLDVNTR